MNAEALARIVAGRRRFAADLAAFVRFASVGADPRRRDDVAACASWLAGRLRRAGLRDAGLARTPGHPIVHASWRGAPSAPTVLVYGHYDVQPAEPLGAWRTPPFAPVLEGEDLVGRGACDDKGPVLCHVAAIESRLATSGRLPANVVCVFEGEEEHGSPNLPAFLRANRPRLAPDVAVMSDTRMRAPGWPSIVDGTRGAVSFEVELSRSGDALHAGQFGGAVANPLEALCAVLAQLHDERGRIAVPGLYDRVRPVAARERARLAREAPSDAELLRSGATDDPAGEAGFSAYERTTLRPALTVTGLSGGYTGPGAQSSVPARAQARLNLRLVPDQDPHEARRLVCARLRALAPAGLALAVRAGPGSRATTIDRRHPAMGAAARALSEAFEREPAFMRSGGSIPIVDVVQELFAVPVVLMGFALPDDGMHAPNERANLPTLHRGTVACARFLELVAGGRRGSGDRGVIVDCHCHAGPGDGLTGPWDTTAQLGPYLARARAAGIGGTVFFAVFHSDYAVANRAVARIVAEDPRRRMGFAFVHAERDRGRIEALVAEGVERHGFRGIKVHRHDARITGEVCEVARRYRLPVLYDVMGETAMVELLATEYPDVDFIIPHLGSFMDDWRAQVALLDPLERHPNIHTDSSGVRRFDLLLQAVRRAGPGKVLFGSDGPWLHPGVELHKIRMLGLAPPSARLVLGENLLRLTARTRRRPRERVAVALAPVAPSAPRADGADPWEAEQFPVGGR